MLATPVTGNDDFADAFALPAETTTFTAEFAGATAEPLDPVTCTNGPGTPTLWYRFTATTTTQLEVDTLDSETYTSLAAYTGDALGALTEIACNRDYEPSRLTLEVHDGDTVYIMAADVFGVGAMLTLNVSTDLKTANDDFTGATDVTTFPFGVAVAQNDSTIQPGEPAPCGTLGSSTWYRIQPAERIVLIGSTLFGSVRLAAYEGTTLGTLTNIACGNNSAPLRLPVAAGATVYVQIGDASPNSGFGAMLSSLVPPVNDNFADATIVGSVPSAHTSDPTNATTEPGESLPCGSPPDTSIWYRYTATTAGTLIVNDSDGPSLNLSAFSGDTVDTLTLRACVLSFQRNELKVAIAAGETISIRAAAFFPFTLQFAVRQPPLNDPFAQPLDVPSLPFSNTVDLSTATVDVGEPTTCGSDSVWYRFIAPTDLVIEASIAHLDNNYSYNAIAAYTGTSLESLQELVCGKDVSRIRFNASAGETVYVRLGVDVFGTPGRLVLDLEGFERPANDDRANARVVPNLPFGDIVDTRGATTEPGEPGSSGCSPASTVWYEFTAPADTTIGIDTSISGGFPTWALYNDALSPIASSCAGQGSNDVARIQAGQRVFLQVGGAAQTLVLHLDRLEPLANDDFANAQHIGAVPFSAELDLTAAQLEGDEPSPCGSQARTAWFSFTAPDEMVIAAEAIGDEFNDDAMIAAYLGSSLGSLTTLDCDDGENDNSRVQVRLQAGETVYLQAGIRFIGTRMLLRVTEAAPPANDDFAQAEPITALPFTSEQDTLAASTQPAEPLSCAGFSPSVSNTVWYRYTAASNQQLHIDMTGTPFSRFAAVYVGSSLNSLSQIACDGFRAIKVDVAAGSTIYIQAGSDRADGGPLQLRVSEIVQPPNDDRANATEVTTLPFTTDVDTLGATNEPGEQNCSSAGVWYRYTTTEDVVVTVDGNGSNQSPYFRVIVEGAGAPAETNCESSRILFALDAGQTAYVRAAASEFEGGVFKVNIKAQPPIANDDFASAEAITSLPFSTQFDTDVATKEAGETFGCGPEDSNVWYKLTSPTDAVIVADARTVSSGTGTSIGIFTGSELASLTRVACVSSHAQFEMAAGSTVYIKVGPSSRFAQRIALDVKSVISPANDDFANAEIVTSLPFTTTPSKPGATLEPGEPANCGFDTTPGSLWYSFTPEQDMKLLVRTRNINFVGEDSLAVYTGGSLTALTQLACKRSFSPPMEIMATTGTPLYIQLGGTLGSIALDIIPLIPPTNDDLADARQISALPYEDTVQTLAATVEPDEPTACGVFRTVWYAYTPAVTTTVRIQASANTQLASFVVGSGAPANDDFVACGPKQQVRVEAGETLYLRGAGFSDELTLRLHEVHPPPNDDVEDAIEVGSLPFAHEMNTGDASLQYQEPAFCRGIETTVWYRYTAENAATISIDTLGSDFDTVLAAYRLNGALPVGLGTIGCTDVIDPTQGEQLQFPVEAGETIYIQASGYYSFTGRLRLNIRELTVPANDHFADAQVIDSMPFSAEFESAGATREVGETGACWSDFDDSVWYTYTANEAISLSVNSFGSDHETLLAAYVVANSAIPPRPRDVVACAGPRFLPFPPPTLIPGPGVIQFALAAGQTMYIQAASADGAGRLKLQIRESAAPANDDIANAIAIDPLPFTETRDVSAATVQEFEGDIPCPSRAPRTVWYQFTAPRDLVALIDTEGSTFNTAIAAFAVGDGGPPSAENLIACDSLGKPSRLRIPLRAGETVYLQVGGAGGDLVLNASIERDGPLPAFDIVMLSPIALERELLRYRDAIHDNIEPSVFDLDGASGFDLCTVAHQLRVAAGGFEAAERLNSSGDNLPCGPSDVIPPGEITAADFASIDLDANQLSENAASYHDALIVVAIANAPLDASLLFSSTAGRWANSGSATYLCAGGDRDCTPDGFDFGRDGLVAAPLSGPFPARGPISVTVELQSVGLPSASATAQIVGDPVALTIPGGTPLRIEVGDGAPCRLPMFAQPSRSIPAELTARAEAPDAALLVIHAVDSDGTLLSNVPVEYAIEEGVGSTAFKHGFTSATGSPSDATAGRNLLCGGQIPGPLSVTATIERAANGACSRSQDSTNDLGDVQCFGRDLPTLSGTFLATVVGTPTEMRLSAAPDTVICGESVDVLLTAALLDAEGNAAVAGHQVRFDPAAFGTADPATALTTADGAARTTVRLASAGQEAATIEAHGPGGISSSVTVTCTPPTATPTQTSTSTATATPTPVRTSTASPTATAPSPTTTATPPASCVTPGQRIVLLVGVLIRFGTRAGDLRYVARYDIDRNGRVNIVDIFLVLRLPNCRGRN